MLRAEVTDRRREAKERSLRSWIGVVKRVELQKEESSFSLEVYVTVSLGCFKRIVTEREGCL